MLEVASLIEDNRFLFAKLDNDMNVEILPLKSRLFITLSERDQAFTHTNGLENELKKLKSKTNFLNDQQANYVKENALLVQKSILEKTILDTSKCN